MCSSSCYFCTHCNPCNYKLIWCSWKLWELRNTLSSLVLLWQPDLKFHLPSLSTPNFMFAIFFCNNLTCNIITYLINLSPFLTSQNVSNKISQNKIFQNKIFQTKSYIFQYILLRLPFLQLITRCAEIWTIQRVWDREFVCKRRENDIQSSMNY